MSRRSPRRLALAVEELRGRIAPARPLSRVQMVWEQAVGEVISAEARPVGERDGVLTIECSSAVWAAELRMLSTEIIERCNAALDGETRIAELRCRVGSDLTSGPG